MAVQEATGIPALVSRESPLESARFGRSIERLTVPEGADDSLSEVRDAASGSAADIVILRYPADRVDWFARLLATPGRDAIFADCLMYWRLRAGAGRRPEPAALRTSGVTGTDVVRSLVADIFHAYGNHYLANPLLDPADALAGYQEWALRFVREDSCVTLRDEETDDILGLATLDETEFRTEILLAGVVSRAQGRGLYAHLLKGIEDRTLARGAAEIEISTQAHNVRVQRAWARYGFEPLRALITVHLVQTSLMCADVGC
ncbi:acetyltransferase (GNAT) family protein [Nonomuraea polychroma]|uniref:Acetyltransferase (GNAT) family protein n=1 Tax=Nonomuraea polychroma TaxID=46176 RepID=A0A438MFJ6_9ACTN|nr:GNAT family N-acetyltransferase [Nonomuraea polychroma]RVX44563.1 acetyltransferase (GNAT) family protein [Nonomuraea polychroma]